MHDTDREMCFRSWNPLLVSFVMLSLNPLENELYGAVQESFNVHVRVCAKFSICQLQTVAIVLLVFVWQKSSCIHIHNIKSCQIEWLQQDLEQNSERWNTFPKYGKYACSTGQIFQTSSQWIQYVCLSIGYIDRLVYC